MERCKHPLDHRYLFGRVKCSRIVWQVYSVFTFGAKAGLGVSRLVQDESWVSCCTWNARLIGPGSCEKSKSPFLSVVNAESMWRTAGWVSVHRDRRRWARVKMEKVRVG